MAITKKRQRATQGADPTAGLRTEAILRRKAMLTTASPGLVRRLDPRTGRVLELLDPLAPGRDPFRHTHSQIARARRRA